MTQEKKETICAVVVTYNRKELLIECLEALRKQTRPIEAMYIIDNASTDGTPEILKEKGYIKELPPQVLKEPWEEESKINNLTSNKPIKVHYVRMHENTGGAGGFHEGVKRAYEKGYDWLWLMDDDGLPTETCLENLFQYKNIADFLAPLVINKDNKEELSFGIFDENKKLLKNIDEISQEYYIATANPFNGILISKSLIQAVGYPKKEMFIWGDEVEYQYRALKYNFNVITVTKAIYFHPKGKVQKKRVLGLYSVNWQNNKLKNYCDIRNKAYLIKNYSKHKVLSIVKFYIKYLIAFLTFQLSVKDFLFLNTAILDGLMERWGKEKKYIGK